MIIPNKHLSLDTCVLNVAANILTVLQSSNEIQITALQEHIETLLGQTIKYTISDALGLLYLLGVIDYIVDNDSIRANSAYVHIS